MTINIFFAHWTKEIDIKRYGVDLQILATGKSTEIYRYSNAILKYMLKYALKTFINRCPHNNDNTSFDQQTCKIYNILQEKEN